jgi:hypothetical protein
MTFLEKLNSSMVLKTVLICLFLYVITTSHMSLPKKLFSMLFVLVPLGINLVRFLRQKRA